MARHTTPHGELILTVMGGLHEFERKLIRQRCDEGIKRVEAMGTLFGRKSVLDAGQRRAAIVRAASLACQNAVKAQKLVPLQKSSEESRWRSILEDPDER